MCDLRVVVRFDDGTIGGYAVDGILSAERLREEVSDAGEVFSDPEASHEFRREEDVPASYRDIFSDMQSLLTKGRV